MRKGQPFAISFALSIMVYPMTYWKFFKTLILIKKIPYDSRPYKSDAQPGKDGMGGRNGDVSSGSGDGTRRPGTPDGSARDACRHGEGRRSD